MKLLGRIFRLFLFLVGAIAGLLVTLAFFFVRQMIRPPRQRLWAVPADAGLDYEDVEFPARDGLRLSGWFVPAAGEGPAPTIVLIHGWPWNRLGQAADDMVSSMTGAEPVDLLRLTHALHGAGYSVLTFDLRNHGESAEGGPVTFGLQESNDLLGALDYLSERKDVDQDRIGAVGFSMGGNTVLYALPHTDRIQAAVAVQPTTPAIFAERYAKDLLGALGGPTLSVASTLYEAAGHVPLSSIDPVFVAPGIEKVPVLYVQGKGDRWGSVSNVAHMADRTPNSVPPLFVDSHHRYGGYRYVVDHPEVVVDFFREQMG